MNALRFAISYLRFSSRKQRKNSSYARQLEDTERYCKEHGLTLVERLEDLGISAWDGSNLDDTAALGGFLQRLETGKVPKGTVLICENLDRLTRGKILDALDLFRRILKQGIEIVTTMDGKRYTEQSVTENAVELMITITYLSRGKNESDTKSERVRKAWIKKRAAIRNNEFSKLVCPSWMSHDGKAFVLNEESARKVRLIFELYVSGYGVPSLIQELKKRGVKPFTKTGRWNEVFIHELLQNPAAMGTCPLIDPPQPNYYPKAIDENLFYKALEKRASNRNFYGKRGTLEVNLFGGLVKCHKCGSSMVKHIGRNGKKDGKIYRNLICSRARTGDCTYEFTNFDKFTESFQFVFASPEYFKPFVESRRQPLEDKTPVIRGRLVEVTANLKRLAGILAQSDIPEIQEQVLSLSNERKELEQQLEAETIRIKTLTNNTELWETYVKQLSSELHKTDFRLALRAFMRKTIDAIVCHRDKYHVHFKNSKEVLTVHFLSKQDQERFANELFKAELLQRF